MTNPSRSTTSVTIDMLSPHFLLLTIAWRTPVWGTDTAILWRADGRASTWKEEELALLKTHYPTLAQGELLQLLPQRSWTSIEKKAEKMGIVRIRRSQHALVNPHITWEDKTVMEQYSLCEDELSSKKQIIWIG